MHRHAIIWIGFVLLASSAAAQPAPVTNQEMVAKAVAAETAGQFGEALRWYRAAAGRGDPEAEDAIGRMYMAGRGVSEDMAEALAWFRKAAAKDHAGAETDLGIMYSAGWGVRQNYSEALNWYLKAPQKGDVVAAESIGMMYLNGLGVPADFEKARPWFDKAIEGGNTSPIPALCDHYTVPLLQAEARKDVAAMDRLISQIDSHCIDLLAEAKARRANLGGSASPNPKSP